MKKKILHIIDGLPRGGAETLLVGTIQYLADFTHIIVSLTPRNDFAAELANTEVITLDFKWYHSIPGTVKQVKGIIEKYQPNVVHAHLYWSTIIARLAAPKGLKQLNSYHNVLYGPKGAKYPVHARLLDKLTYRKRITTLCVSSEVAKDVKKYIGITDNVAVLYNYIENQFFENYRPASEIEAQVKLVAVGNLKPQKNYNVIIEAFDLLQQQGISQRFTMDIYGKGDLLPDFEKLLSQKSITNLHFKGAVPDVAARLPQYDLYIISSAYEGFGIAVAEAMAVGLPVLVSGIEVLREVTAGKAILFDPFNPADLASKLKEVLEGKHALKQLSIEGNAHAQLYRKHNYMKRLSTYYNT